MDNSNIIELDTIKDKKKSCNSFIIAICILSVLILIAATFVYLTDRQYKIRSKCLTCQNCQTCDCVCPPIDNNDNNDISYPTIPPVTTECPNTIDENSVNAWLQNVNWPNSGFQISFSHKNSTGFITLQKLRDQPTNLLTELQNVIKNPDIPFSTDYTIIPGSSDILQCSFNAYSNNFILQNYPFYSENRTQYRVITKTQNSQLLYMFQGFDETKYFSRAYNNYMYYQDTNNPNSKYIFGYIGTFSTDYLSDKAYLSSQLNQKNDNTGNNEYIAYYMTGYSTNGNKTQLADVGTYFNENIPKLPGPGTTLSSSDIIF